ncbi:MAG: glycosyltransferase [Desulfobacteraceae bacterium]|nr:glycosyltransferase [Desulfobacteraceae bacterium]
MKETHKVFLTGGDAVKWATDDDYNLLQKSLSSFCESVNLKDCNIIHSVNWHALLKISPTYLADRYVITHIPHDIKNMLMQSDYLKISPFVDKWIVMSKRGKKMLQGTGFNYNYVPYSIDMKRFYQIDKSHPKLSEIRKKYNIPTDKYLIGSFQRDTEGTDLKTAKYMKGPDVFFEIVKRLYQHNKDIFVILAGPRRFWLIKQLTRNSIPFVYIGKIPEVDGNDDIYINTLSQTTINCLYNLLDLYLVTSRMEGGPKAIIECAAAKCKIISTNVGHASDILDPKTIYLDPIEGFVLILDDIENDTLTDSVNVNFQEVVKGHSIEIVRRYWEKIYHEVVSKELRSESVDKLQKRDGVNRTIFNIFRNRKIITILHKFHKPPWGGGNQFLLALKKGINNKGKKVNNKLTKNSKLCIFNSFLFDMNTLKSNRKDYSNTLMVHRVDGPTLLVRGKDKEIDDEIFEINNMVADITVFQSFWSYQKTIELGYKPINPIIIPNTVDYSIFNKNGKNEFSNKKKIRLISTSWSNNQRKGFDIYKWLDNNLDSNRFEYTFVGNIPTDLEFKNIIHIPPVPSKELATILKTNDVFITASSNDPCSNAVIEALSCGLPVLYFNGGGHQEIIGYGGLGFNTKEEILKQLDYLLNNYELFQKLIYCPSLNEITDKYLSLLNLTKL